MSKRFWTGAFAAVAAAASLTACGGGSGGANNEGVSKDEVTIGVMVDGSGPTASDQLPWQHGFEAYVKRLNDAGGVDGRKVKVVVKDDKFDAAVGVTAYKSLESQTPSLAIFGLGSGGPQSAVAPLAAKDEIPVVTGLLTTKESLVPFNPYVFGMAPSYADQVDVILAHGKEKVGSDTPRVAVVDNGAATGIEVEELVEERAVEGVEYAGAVAFPPTETTGDAIVQKLISMKPDFVVYHGGAGNVNLLMKAQAKFGTEMPVIGITPTGSYAAYQGLDPEVGNLFEFVQWSTPSTLEVEGTKQLLEDAEAAGFGEDDISASTFTQGYVAGMVLEEALKGAGDDPTRESFRDALEGISDLDTLGLSSSIRYSAENHGGASGLRPMKYDYATETFETLGEFSDYEGFIVHQYTK
ncbi:ABC transporter substrate-binding protein [Nocardioides humi]|nr:ABC transporter substrate-binding protein [Nocardioides humi]